MIQEFDFKPRTRVVAGAGAFSKLAGLLRELAVNRVLIVADPGMRDAGYVDQALAQLAAASLEASVFSNFAENPTSDMVELGRVQASGFNPEAIVGLGGGSSMDCCKGINFVLSNGGRMEDYWGYGKAAKMLPMIGVPTTTGTGSEAQSYALISQSATHVKMACGDPKASFRVAILDPELTRSQPLSVRAAAGYDAVSHAVETWVTTRRNAMSECFSREAWRLLSGSYEGILGTESNPEDFSRMQLGAHFAGAAIENSMLGATHACANPLTQNYGTTHGAAIAVLLPHVVRWNGLRERYRELDPDLIPKLNRLRQAAGLPQSLQQLDIPDQDLPSLAEAASAQWTGRFNPRELNAAGALEIYQCAY